MACNRDIFTFTYFTLPKFCIHFVLPSVATSSETRLPYDGVASFFVSMWAAQGVTMLQAIRPLGTTGDKATETLNNGYGT
jgi:hypothetical protein